jgi:hypothetical protein
MGGGAGEREERSMNRSSAGIGKAHKAQLDIAV